MILTNDGFHQFHLVGVSVGGMIAQHVALLVPEVGKRREERGGGGVGERPITFFPLSFFFLIFFSLQKTFSLTLMVTRVVGGTFNNSPTLKGTTIALLLLSLLSPFLFYVFLLPSHLSILIVI